jgi:hypothetical protein
MARRMKSAGSIAIDVVRRVAGGKRPALDRSFAGRFARRLAKKHRRNWRENGLRPRGRGYDWARQLIPEELIKATGADGLGELTASELARRVGCAVRTVRYYVKRLASVDANGRPASPANACITLLPVSRGRGFGMRWKVHPTEIAGLLKWLQTRKAARFAKRSPQLSLFPEKPMEIPEEIQAQIDRIANLAKQRASIRPPSEERANRSIGVNNSFFVGKSDLFPHTPISQKLHQVSSPPASLDRTASPPRVEIPSRVPPISVRPDRNWLRTDWLEIREIEKSDPEPLSERHRRRLMRHLRFACWNRGLDQARTRHVVGAIGWEAQRMRKATSRRYLIIDGIAWVMASSPAELRGATGHFLGMVKVVRGLSSGSDVARPPAGRASNRARIEP